jgi:exodeoxyribonuclease-3
LKERALSVQARVATWNINSVRLRTHQVVRFLELWEPDVLCLQETKCPEGHFPSADFAKLGYRHIAQCGQAGYHGVAIVSRIAFEDSFSRQFCGRQDARHVAVRLAAPHRLCIHSLYVPAGGDVPDPLSNPKFAHKLSFLDELAQWLPWVQEHSDAPTVLAGDLNIAPLEHDVWSHRQLLKVVSHTPVETERLTAIRMAGQWIDVMREHVPHDQKLYTWWSYRARDWALSDRGRRLDHIWLDARLAGACRSLETVRETRGWLQPSDHVPVVASLDL